MENKFLGNGWSFPPAFYLEGAEVEMVSGEEDIRQSLQIILSTSLKERLMHSDFGSDLSSFLFEEGGQQLINDIQNIISNALLIYEPRVKLNEVLVQDPGIEAGRINISIDYTVRTTNNRFNLVYPFYLNEASI